MKYVTEVKQTCHKGNVNVYNPLKYHVKGNFNACLKRTLSSRNILNF